jgi:hypothetical protein
MQQPQSPQPAQLPSGRFWSLPRTVAGWCAVVAGIGASAFDALIPSIQNALNRRYCDTNGALCIGGREYVAFGLAIGLIASAIGIFAIAVKRDRTVLVVLTVVPALLVTLFWLFFAAGEIIAPH